MTLLKTVLRKNLPKIATNFGSARGLAMHDQRKESSVDNLVYQRVGKSRQEIVDFMKILKTL